MDIKEIKEILLDNNIDPVPDLIDLILDIEKTYYKSGYRDGLKDREVKNK